MRLQKKCKLEFFRKEEKKSRIFLGLQQTLHFSDIPDLFEAKAYCQKNFDTFPAAVTRCVNAEPFRVGVSSIMYDHLHRMILENTPIDDLI